MPPKPRPVMERLMAKIEIDENGCWMWTGSTSGSKPGYGQIYVHGQPRPIATHRVAYEELVGPIPEGLELDHLCYLPSGYSNRLCCNPEHLELVTRSRNAFRGFEKLKAAGWVHYKQREVN